MKNNTSSSLRTQAVKEVKLREQTKLMKKYAKLCGYDTVPLTWKATDYSIVGWKYKIAQINKVEEYYVTDSLGLIEGPFDSWAKANSFKQKKENLTISK